MAATMTKANIQSVSEKLQALRASLSAGEKRALDAMLSGTAGDVRGFVLTGDDGEILQDARDPGPADNRDNCVVRVKRSLP